MSDDKNISHDTETYYENNPRAADLDEVLDHAAEELIAGDSDDPPLSEDGVADLLRKTQNR